MTHRIIDLNSDHDWSLHDIRNRSEAEIAREFSPIDFQILQRKVHGTAFGYVLTSEDQAELQRYQLASFHAGEMADQAYADMALLRKAWAVEAAQRALLGELDEVARAGHQAVIDAADLETLALVGIRARVVLEPLPEEPQE